MAEKTTELILAYDLKDLNEFRELYGIGYCRFILTSYPLDAQITVYAKLKWKKLKHYIVTEKATKGEYYPTDGKIVTDKCADKKIKKVEKTDKDKVK